MGMRATPKHAAGTPAALVKYDEQAPLIVPVVVKGAGPLSTSPTEWGVDTVLSYVLSLRHAFLIHLGHVRGLTCN